MDALLDLRNLLAQGYVPVMGQDGRNRIYGPVGALACVADCRLLF